MGDEAVENGKWRRRECWGELRRKDLKAREGSDKCGGERRKGGT